MPRGIIAALLCALAGSLPATAQDLLPTRFANWESSEVRRAAPSALDQLAGDNAGVLREYGIRGSEQRVYSSGGATLRITLHRMIDPTAAYGGFTLLRTPEMNDTGWTRYAAASRGRALVVVGDFLLDIEAPGAAAPREAMGELVQVLSPHADATPFPPFAQYLPEDGLVKGSPVYARGPQALARAFPRIAGDWLGFDDGVEVQLARYRRGGREFTVVLAAYPTPQIAAARLEGLGQRFVVNGEGAGDPALPPLTVKRRSSLVMIAVDPSSPVAAGQLLDEVRYATAVTWNEPTDYFRGPNIGTIVITSFVAIGLLFGLALVFGLGFGGIRLISKRLFPGRVFDSEEKVEILQLGITSKPIDAQDFYLPDAKPK